MSKKPLKSKACRKSFRRETVSPTRFFETRKAAGFTRIQAAEFLGVSLRTVGHWETGRARPSYAAFKLLRVLRNGQLIDPAWHQFRLIRGRLVTPEGHSFHPADMSWQSLLCRQAEAFRDLIRTRRLEATVGHAGGRLAESFTSLVGSPLSVPGSAMEARSDRPQHRRQAQLQGMFQSPSVGDKGAAMAGVRCLTPPVCPENAGQQAGLSPFEFYRFTIPLPVVAAIATGIARTSGGAA